MQEHIIMTIVIIGIILAILGIAMVVGHLSPPKGEPSNDDTVT